MITPIPFARAVCFVCDWSGPRRPIGSALVKQDAIEHEARCGVDLGPTPDAPKAAAIEERASLWPLPPDDLDEAYDAATGYAPADAIRTDPCRWNAEGYEQPRAVYEGDALLGYLLPVAPQASTPATRPSNRYGPSPQLAASIGCDPNIRWPSGPVAYRAIVRMLGA